MLFSAFKVRKSYIPIMYVYIHENLEMILQHRNIKFSRTN